MDTQDAARLPADAEHGSHPGPGPRPPTWREMRETILNREGNLDAPRDAPRGVTGAQHERWLQGYDYNPREVAEPPPPPPKPRRKVEAKVPERHLTPKPADGQKLAKALRDRGVRSARWAGGELHVDDHERDRASRVLDRLAEG